jgi:hypothetical protein
MEHVRLSPAVARLGTKRPEVHNLQGALEAVEYYDGDLTGIVDDKTAAAIKTFQSEAIGPDEADGIAGRVTYGHLLERAKAAGWQPVTMRLLQAVICFYETSTCRNAYGNTSLLDDGAGCNYGVLQHNSLGSLVSLLKRAGRDDLVKAYKATPRDEVCHEVKAWMGSEAGVVAQDDYFTDKIYGLAKGYSDEMPGMYKLFNDAGLRYLQRYMLILCDCVVQNGALWSPKRKPFWRSLTDDEAKVAKYRELYYGHRFDELMIETECGGPLKYDQLKAEWYSVEREVGQDNRREVNRRTMIRLLAKIPSPRDRLVLMAQMRARSSSPKWWTTVERRRMLDATGKGKVNGVSLELERDFGFASAPDCDQDY